jgi:hypothetical protein
MKTPKAPKTKSLARMKVPKPRKPRRRKILRTEVVGRIYQLTELIKGTLKRVQALKRRKNPDIREIAQMTDKVHIWQKDLDTLANVTPGRSKYIYFDRGAA